MPSVPGSGATVDPSAFARGVSAGSGVAGAVPPVSPPPSVPASPAAAGPVAGGTPSSMPAGLAASGAHTPAGTGGSDCHTAWRCARDGRDDAAAARYGWSCRARYGRWCGGDDSGDGSLHRLAAVLPARVVR